MLEVWEKTNGNMVEGRGVEETKRWVESNIFYPLVKRSLQASLPSHGPVIYCSQEGEVCSAFHNQLKGKPLVLQ